MPRPPRLITVRGVTKTLQNWASDTGISPSTLRNRLRRGFSPERVIEKPTKNTERLITIKVDTRPLAEWLKHYNRDDATFYLRLARGFSEQNAITTPPARQTTTLPRVDKHDKLLNGRAGVYAIRCKAIKRYYIGSSTNLVKTKGRWSSNLKAQVRRSLPKRLLPDLQKHGASSFEFCVLEFCARSRVRITKSKLLRRAEKKHPRRLYNS